jgi:hypothetical protein
LDANKWKTLWKTLFRLQLLPESEENKPLAAASRGKIFFHHLQK